MVYEGTFPPTQKKLLLSSWKYMAHAFVSCISGRKSGANEISLVNTSAIAALASRVDFNFSKFIQHEMILKVEGNKRDKFLMYPRFIQLILNVKHPEIKRGRETLDIKYVGSSAFGLMKQNRSGKLNFVEIYPLIKFGIFAEESDQSKSDSLSCPTETDDVIIFASEHKTEESRVSHVAIVAEEHDRLQNVEVESDFDQEGDN